MLKSGILFFLVCFFALGGQAQNIDSLVAQKAVRLVHEDTVIKWAKFRLTGFDANGKIIFAGNLNKDKQKNGPWLYFGPDGRYVCWGIFRRNQKNGWWQQRDEGCRVKYKKEKVIKRICTPKT
jgi:hypothetical protein